MNTETGIKTESGIVIVTGSNGTIGDAVMRRFAGRFDDVVGRGGVEDQILVDLIMFSTVISPCSLRFLCASFAFSPPAN